MTQIEFENFSTDENDVKKLLDERGKSYGDAWWLAGMVTGVLFNHNVRIFDRLIASFFLHNWVLILSKMMRILVTPYEAEHWKDIEGYARLVRDKIEITGESYE